MLNDLVLANHILADHEVVDSFGHISMRHPDRPDRYLLSCSRAPYLVSEDDIMEYTLDNEALTQLPKGIRGYGELVKLFKETFKQVKPIKPKASRDKSSETFLVGVGLRQIT